MLVGRHFLFNRPVELRRIFENPGISGLYSLDTILDGTSEFWHGLTPCDGLHELFSPDAMTLAS